MSLAPAPMVETPSATAAQARRPRARFRRLVLTDFRSYRSTDIQLDGRPVTLSGANGAGKTNILEAISLIGPGRGLRGAKLDELPRIGGAGGWAVSARMETNDGDEIRLGVGATAQAPERRVCRIEERAAKGPSAFSDHVRLMWLTPAQDRLFMEGASDRRRFIDRMTMAFDPAHGRAANDFEKAMRQRQRLLDERSRDEAWLTALEAQMAEAGVAIAAARRETVSMLAATEIASAEKGGKNIFPSSDLALEGVLETALANRPAADVEEDYSDRLKHQRRADCDAGRALMGPHRSDLVVSHREKNQLARLCSTGEQKALLIGLVLANARALAKSHTGGGAPLVLLLDEIAAHLDEGRRSALFDILDEIGFQTFMTGTDQTLFSGWRDRAQCFSVAEGGVREIDNE